MQKLCCVVSVVTQTNMEEHGGTLQQVIIIGNLTFDSNNIGTRLCVSTCCYHGWWLTGLADSDQ